MAPAMSAGTVSFFFKTRVRTWRALRRTEILVLVAVGALSMLSAMEVTLSLQQKDTTGLNWTRISTFNASSHYSVSEETRTTFMGSVPRVMMGSCAVGAKRITKGPSLTPAALARMLLRGYLLESSGQCS